MTNVLRLCTVALLLYCSVNYAICSFAELDLPGVYEVASNDKLAISVVDVHKYDQGLSWDWTLTLGLAVENRINKTISLNPNSFYLIDGSWSSRYRTRKIGLGRIGFQARGWSQANYANRKKFWLED
jgi:hypothetical protein